jgi:hypothetical protein
MEDIAFDPLDRSDNDSVTQGSQVHASSVLVLVPVAVRLLVPAKVLPAAARPIGVRRTTSQPASSHFQGSACNAQTASPGKTYSYRNWSLLVNFARVVGSHVLVTTFHGHLFAHRLVLSSLLNGVFDGLFAARLVVAMGGTLK